MAAKIFGRVVPVASSNIATTSFQWFGLLYRSALPDLIELLANFDLLDRMNEFLSTLCCADWRGAYDRAGMAGVVREFFASVAAINCWTLFVSRRADWSGLEIEQFLRRYGVRVWGRGFSGDHFYFRVKHPQARWVEYLLLRRGMPVTSIPFDPRNPTHAESHTPGDEPPRC